MGVENARNIRAYSDLEVENFFKNQEELCLLNLPQIEDLTFRLRQLKKVGYSKVLQELTDVQCIVLAEYFKEHSTQAIAEWSQTQPQYKAATPKKKLASVYHQAPHGAEMRKDAELFLTQRNIQSIFQNPAQRMLFTEMTAAAHAIHDVIQDKGPLRNEIESFLVFITHCEKIFTKACEVGLISIVQKAQMLRQAKFFGWEVIVVGTIFDTQKKMPLIDSLNTKAVEEQQRGELKENSFPAQPDVAIACASFAAGKNDTRRMEVVLSNYLHSDDLKQLIDEQFEATGGDNNIFMRYLKKDTKLTESDKIGFRHMIGQNCRMICEIKTHFARPGKDDEAFAEFLGLLIFKASEQFDKIQWETLKTEFADLDDSTLFNFFETFISSFEGPFGEISFAKGLNATIFKESIDNFNRLYPSNAFSLTGGELWNKYALALEGFIKDLRIQVEEKKDVRTKRKFIVETFIELALYGGHQIGNALLRLDDDLPAQQARLVEDVAKRVQPMFHHPLLTRNVSSLRLLANLQIELNSNSEDVDALTTGISQMTLSPQFRTMGRKEYSPQAKREGLWMFYKVKDAAARLKRQKVQHEEAEHRKKEKTAKGAASEKPKQK